jgi:hypothetical protein
LTFFTFHAVGAWFLTFLGRFGGVLGRFGVFLGNFGVFLTVFKGWGGGAEGGIYVKRGKKVCFGEGSENSCFGAVFGVFRGF